MSTLESQNALIDQQAVYVCECSLSVYSSLRVLFCCWNTGFKISSLYLPASLYSRSLVNGTILLNSAFFVPPFFSRSKSNFWPVSFLVFHSCVFGVPTGSTGWPKIVSHYRFINKSMLQLIRSSIFYWPVRILRHEPNPIYLGVTMDRSLTFHAHLKKSAAKLANGNNLLSLLAGSLWGCTGFYS